MKAFTNIGKLLGVYENALSNPLVGSDLKEVPTLENAFLLCRDGLVERFGKMEDFQEADGYEVVDLSGASVLPGWCDSHTHTVFAAKRNEEMVMRIAGSSYQEIAQAGGGILNSARRLDKMDEEELYQLSHERVIQIIEQGTTSLEIKSGYGLNTDSELKILRIVRRLKEHFPIPIKATFLGAHTIPAEYKENRQGYVQLLVDEMLPKIADEGLADYIDVFCEKVAFTADETDQILTAGAKHGLKAKIHTNQFNSMGGIETAIKHKALSVDHLEVMTNEEIQILKESNTMACLLPSAPFFINDPYPPARQIIDADISVVLASDYNPGSSPSYNMSFVNTLACTKMGMLPAEAFNASTVNASFALEIEDQTGSLFPGSLANFMVAEGLKDLSEIAYSFGEQMITQVYVNGNKF